MADSSIPVTSGSGNNVDTRTNAAGDHRQVVVFGDPSITNNVAAVISQDVGGNDQTTQAVAVRLAGSASVQVVGSSGTIGVHIQSTNGTLAVRFADSPIVTAYGMDGTTGRPFRMNSDGAIKIYDIAQGSVTVSGTLTGITNSIAVHILSTNGTMGVKFSDEPTVVASGKQGTTTRPFLMNTDGAIKIYDIAAGSVTVSGTITGITNSIAVHVLSTNGTMAVNVGKVDGTVAVFFSPGTPSINNASWIGSTAPTVGSKTSASSIPVVVASDQGSMAVHILSTGGTLNVRLSDNSAGLITDDTPFTPATDLGFPMMGFFDDTSTDSVDEGDAGIVRMTGNRILMSHTDSTASLFTVSGSTSGVSVLGTTLVSPSANASFKVYAYSIQTTGAVSVTATFTNGAGSATEFWRPLITASGVTGSQGANLTATPGAPLFATGVSTTLALKLDSATLVHYSVAYTKESA